MLNITKQPQKTEESKNSVLLGDYTAIFYPHALMVLNSKGSSISVEYVHLRSTKLEFLEDANYGMYLLGTNTCFIYMKNIKYDEYLRFLDIYLKSISPTQPPSNIAPKKPLSNNPTQAPPHNNNRQRRRSFASFFSFVIVLIFM